MARILVIDDNADTRQSMTMFLEASGHVVTAMPNGRDALSHVLVELPDAILLDLLMPGMDGPSFVEVVRSYLRLQSLPVVVYTALEDGPKFDRAKALKVNAVLVKGKATPADVLHALEEAVARLPG